MTLDKLRPYTEGALAPFVDAADRLGLSPDAVSLVALATALLAGVAYYLAAGARWWYLVGAVLVFLNGWLDLVDGELARRLGTESAAGDLLDHVFDRYADVFVVVGLAAAVGRYDLGVAAVTGVLLTSYLGTQAQAVGIDRLYGGLVGRADRLAIIGVATAVAAAVDARLAGLSVVGWLLVFLAVVGHLTALQRLYYALDSLR